MRPPLPIMPALVEDDRDLIDRTYGRRLYWVALPTGYCLVVEAADLPSVVGWLRAVGLWSEYRAIAIQVVPTMDDRQPGLWKTYQLKRNRLYKVEELQAMGVPCGLIGQDPGCADVSVVDPAEADTDEDDE